MLGKFKLYAAAVLAFFLALLSAKYYRGKAKRLEKQVKAEKNKINNLSRQVNAARRHQKRQAKEIEDGLEDGSYLKYFDDQQS